MVTYPLSYTAVRGQRRRFGDHPYGDEGIISAGMGSQKANVEKHGNFYPRFARSKG